MTKRRFTALAILMLAGESVFLLPFVLVRIFRPTFLEAFDINNLQLGTAFSIYGVIALVSYFFGGPIADRYSAKKLLSISLFLTAIGGLILASQPSFYVLCFLYGFWGISSILLFWAAFIKAIRSYGGESGMGRSYGGVDAGRGLTAAVMASIAVALYDSFIGAEIEFATQDEKIKALSSVILSFTLLTAIAGALALLIKDRESDLQKSPHINWGVIREAAANKKTWWQAMVVLCAYTAYRSTDDISLYGTVVLGMDEVSAGKLVTLAFWLRPVGAVLAGLLGDRFGISRMCQLSFILIIIGSLMLGSPLLLNVEIGLVVVSISIGSLGIYGLRGLYFALFKENKVALQDTGVAVGLISVIGYSPDIFFGPLMGYILDSAPGNEGHHQLFILVAAFAAFGLFASYKVRGAKA